MRTILAYITRPYKLIVSSASILILFFVIILVNKLTDTAGEMRLQPSAQWVFVALPKYLYSMLARPYGVALVALVYVIKYLFTLFVTQDMVRIYQRNRAGLVDSLLHIKAFDALWLALAEVVIDVAFALGAGVIYIVGYIAWREYGLDSWLILIIVLIGMYPLFYLTVSTTAMVSVLPLSSVQRIEKLYYLCTRSSLLKLYTFYAIRLYLEALLLVGIPYMAIWVIRVPWLGLASGALGLVLPFAMLRGSSYELKLDLYRNDPDMQRIFRHHYDSTAR